MHRLVQRRKRFQKKKNSAGPPASPMGEGEVWWWCSGAGGISQLPLRNSSQQSAKRLGNRWWLRLARGRPAARRAPPLAGPASGPTDNSRLNSPEKNRCTSSAEQDQGKPRTFTTKPSPPSAPSIIVSSRVLASKQTAGLRGGGGVSGTRLRNSHLNGPPTTRRPAGSGRCDGSPAREDASAPETQACNPASARNPIPKAAPCAQC